MYFKECVFSEKKTKQGWYGELVAWSSMLSKKFFVYHKQKLLEFIFSLIAFIEDIIPRSFRICSLIKFLFKFIHFICIAFYSFVNNFKKLFHLSKFNIQVKENNFAALLN